jgi:hypothetical protein
MTERKIVTLGDIERGIASGARKRVLYGELSKIADISRGKTGVVEEAVKMGLRRVAERIRAVKRKDVDAE